MPTATPKSIQAAGSDAGDFPYVMRLPGQRAVAMTIPREWVSVDRSNEVMFLPPAIRWLDRIRALFIREPQPLTPGFLRSLRDAMGLTQEELAIRLGVTKMTISRWERGTMKPGESAVHSIMKLRARLLRRGLRVDGTAA